MMRSPFDDFSDPLAAYPPLEAFDIRLLRNQWSELPVVLRKKGRPCCVNIWSG